MLSDVDKFEMVLLTTFWLQLTRNRRFIYFNGFETNATFFNIFLNKIKCLSGHFKL